MFRNPQSWADDAACDGMDITAFFPEDVYGDTAYGELALRAYVKVAPVCAGCPVRQECEDDVMGTEQPHYRHGYVAGMTPNQRDRLHRERKKAAA